MQKWQTVEEALLWLKRQGMRADKHDLTVRHVKIKGKATLAALDYLRKQKVALTVVQGGATLHLSPAQLYALQGRN